MPRPAPSPARPAVAGAGATILVVDDEDSVADLVAVALECAGHRVERAATGPEALDRIAAHAPDLVVLDVVLPGLGGMDVLREVRRTSRVPVILLSGITDVGERVAGLEAGADDYLTKPFSPRELAARVRSVLRRAAPEAGADVVEVEELRIDRRSREVTVRGVHVALTTKEFDLLAFLASSPREVFSREQLLRRVWSSTTAWQDPSTVTEHVRRVRLKLQAAPQHRPRITTVRGAGYRLEG
jgi:DNA-binding response OmpR family regulator